MSGQPKLSSRLSSLNMFGKFSTKPPPPVEKDPWYKQGSIASKSAVSLTPSHALSLHGSASIASMSVETLQLPQTPLSSISNATAARSQCDLSRTMSPVSVRSRMTTAMSSAAPSVHSQASEMSSLRRGISKLSSSLGKKSRLFLRSNLSRTTLSADSARASHDGMTSDSEGDGAVSKPWNVQHHLHVDEGLANLPPAWMDQLRAEGFKDTDVLSIHSRRNRTTYLHNHPDVSPDVIRARSQSPYTTSSTSTSPSSLSPLPANALPTRSTSLRRPTTGASDSASLSTSGRSFGSSLSPDSTSPPSSYGFHSANQPSDSSVSSRAPSVYVDGDDDYSDPGTATASRFGISAAPTSVVPRVLPRIDGLNGDLPPSVRVCTPPSRTGTASTFRVTNPTSTPPSPPPAYDVSEPNSAYTNTFPRDEKQDPAAKPSPRRASRSDVQLHPERRSEETLTPEVLLRENDSNAAPLGRATHSDEAAQLPNGTHPSSVPIRLHLTTPSCDESLSPSPPESPLTRTTSSPPRLSLHQDDLSSWTASLFSAMHTPDAGLGSSSNSSDTATTASASTTASVDSTSPIVPAKATSPKTKKAPVPPLVLSRPSNEVPRVTIETDEDEIVEAESVDHESLERGAGTSTPLFNEVLSLVKPPNSTTPTTSPPLTSTYPYLPSPPPPSTPGHSSQGHSSQQSHAQASPSQSPNATYEFLKQSHDPHRNSTLTSSTSSRDSQATISASSRWSRATTVRDVRDATIGVAHMRKGSVANAMTVPAPAPPSKHKPQLSASTVQTSSSGSGNEDWSRPMSMTSSDGVPAPSASDFPLPPPSPSNAIFGGGSLQPSPMSAKFSVRSTESDVRLPYTVEDPSPVNRLSSPASTRSSQSSSGSGSSSSSSSQVNPLSIRSGSDEGAEEHDGNTRLNGAVHVQLRYTESEGEVGVLSPTESAESEVDTAKWDTEEKKLSSTAHIDIAPRIYTCEADNDNDDGSGREDLCCEQDGIEERDGTSPMVDWLVDTPSPQYELHNKPIRDSGTLYNYLGERSPRPPLHPDAATESSRRPSLQINGIPTLNVGGDAAQKQLVQHLSPASAGPSSSSSSSASTSASATPSPSPLQRYRGWVSEVVAPLEEFIDHSFDPRGLFTDLQEIAEGESGSVFSASIVPSPPSKSKLQSSTAHISKNESGKVAIKQVPLLPGGSPKLEEMRKELILMSRVSHEHILSMDALFVDLVEDALWIEMELMERSLADVLGLVEEGLVFEERVIARCATDILSALAHLETLGIVHRDVRSDNLLVNSQGALKLADFSNALLVDPAYPTYKEPAGVIYWQAPEMRSSPYDAQKVDIWSAGATVWEMAEAEPPFMHIEVNDTKDLPERWPTLSKATEFSRSFHDFLNLCSNPPSERPSAHDLLTTPFILSACDRSLIVDLLSQCKTIEERVHRRTSTDSEGTVLS